MTAAPNSSGDDSINEEILAELRKMSKVMVLVNGDKIESQLAKYATTPERKKIWALMDGTRDMNELIKSSGLKQAQVYKFVTALENAGLVSRSRGQPPVRIVDFVPAEWAELIDGGQVINGERQPSDVASGAGSENSGGDNFGN